MKEKIPILFFVFLFAVITVTSVIAKPTKAVDVLLTPAQYGKVSRAIPVLTNKPELPEVRPIPKKTFFSQGPESSPFTTVDRVLSYDNGTEASYLGGLAATYHLGVWFKSPAACTLLAVYYDFYNGGPVTYYVADPADTIDFKNDYEEYHGGANPGPSPIETYLHPEESGTAVPGWDTLQIPEMPDVGTNAFFAAYIMDDGNSNPIIDASIPEPPEGFHTLMQRPGGGGGPFGWYSSWHHVYIRALVRMYENPPPMVEKYDKLPNSYVTTGREVTATFSDLGIPLDSTGVVSAWCHYRVDGGAWDSLAMTIISGDGAYGVWKAILPAISAGSTMEYYFSCKDMQGLETTNPPAGNPASYTIKAKSGDVLFVNDDYYGDGYSYDVISDVLPGADQWDISSDGVPDASVLLAGYNVIIWNTWEYSGASFAADTAYIAQFLSNGGNLLVSGMDIPAGEFGYSWGDYTTTTGEFLRDYFGIIGGTDDFASDSISVYYGRTGDTIAGIFNEQWPITVYPYYFVGPGYNFTGRFTEPVDTTQWVGILYDELGNCSAFRYEQPGMYKVVWLYFPFAYMEDYSNPYNPDIDQQRQLIERILDWFSPGPIVREVTQYQTTAAAGPYPVNVKVINFADSLQYVDLIVSANGTVDTISMTPTLGDTFIYTADIPAYTTTTDIKYYVVAMDAKDNRAYSKTYEFWYYLPTANVLYVNESYDPVLDYQDVLDSLGISGGYDVYDPSVYGKPDSTVLPSYNAVIWNGDWGYGTILTKSSAGNVLYDYMLKGGNIFFNSDEILGLFDGWSNVDYSPGDFPYDVLKVNHIYNDACYDSVYGVTGDTITNGIVAEETFPVDNWNDEIGIDSSAIAIFTDAGATTVRGVRWFDANNKVVFLPFMYVSLPKSIQIQVLGNVMNWFGTAIRISSKGDERGNTPKVFALSQNSPNPFGEKTAIQYALPKTAQVSLKIYNATGQVVKTLVNGVEKPGYRTVFWNGRDSNNRRVAQGVYFYRLTAGNFRATKKLLILR